MSGTDSRREANQSLAHDTDVFAGPTRGLSLGESLSAKVRSGRKLLVPYVTGGISTDWVLIVEAMAEAGADAIEVGIPFSDPVMDGPTIQQASVMALRRGTTFGSIVADLRAAEIAVPLIAMTYYNIVVRHGHRRFARGLSDAGIRAAILPDVPLEELGEWSRAAEWTGIDTVLLAAPVSTDARLADIAARSRGFVYGVNLMGVTGERAAVADSASVLAKRLKAVTDLPVIMGFGISTPDQAAQVAGGADGVVVASALMRLVLDGSGPEDLGRAVALFRNALDSCP